MRTTPILLALACLVAIPCRADEAPRRVHITIPPDSAPASATPVVTPETPAAPEDEEISPQTAAWLEHCSTLEERHIGRGTEIGGNAALGIRLGGKGQASQLGDVDPKVLAGVDAWNEQGALVLSVVPGSPADIAGLEPGDVVVQFAGLWIDTPDMLVRMASRAEVGREMELLFLRENAVERTWLSAIDRKELEALK